MNLYIWEHDHKFVAFALASNTAHARELVSKSLPKGKLTIAETEALLNQVPLMVSTAAGFNVWRGLSES